MIGRSLILGAMVLASGTAPAAGANLSAVCKPDDESLRFLQSDLASVSWLVTVDPIPQPPTVRIEAKDAKPLRLIDGPAERYYQGADRSWILESVMLDPSLGLTAGRQIVYNYQLTLREGAKGVEIERGTVRYRLGPTDIMTGFKFECRPTVPAKKASAANMTAHPAGGEG